MTIIIKDRYAGIELVRAETLNFFSDIDEPAELVLGRVVRQALDEGMNLRGASLEGVDMAGATLRARDLGKIRAPKSRWGGCDLRDTTFEGADLRGADFEGADLRGCNFKSTDLEGVNFTNATLWDASFDVANFGGAGVVLAAPIQLGPIGLHRDHITGFSLSGGLYIAANNFFDTLAAFRFAVAEEHTGTDMLRPYTAALDFIEAYLGVS